MVQARMDPNHPRGRRAQHLRAVGKPPAVAAVLAMAANRRRDLERAKFCRPDFALCGICSRMAYCAGKHFRDQSLRSFRTAAGLSLSARSTIFTDWIQNSWSLPICQASALPGLADGFLGHAYDDGGAPG